MKITQYDIELSEDKLPYLVKENEFTTKYFTCNSPDKTVYSGLIKIFEITNKVSNADNIEVSVHKIQKPIIGMSNQATLGTIDNINNILKGVLDSNDFRNKR